MLISIDPGIKTGWAQWHIDGYLTDCGLDDPPRTTSLADNVIIERPVIYPRSKAPPNDIIELALLAGKYAGMYDWLGATVWYTKPSEWKGQTPKAIHHKRIKATLNENERDLISLRLPQIAFSYQHNVLDAIGLGLWYLKRIR